MGERDEDFDDLVDGGAEFAEADEGSDAGKSPVEGDEGKGDEGAGAASDADKGKSPKEGDESDDDDEDEGSKDGPAAKDAKDADKDADKDQKMVPKKALDSAKRRTREIAARLKRLEDRMEAEDLEVARRSIPKEGTPEHATYVAQQATVVQINDKLNFSEYHARKAHGDDTVNEAFDWANEQIEKDPKFAETLFAHADPYDYAVTLHKQALEQSTGGGEDDPDWKAFLAWKASQANGGDAGAAPQPKAAEQPAKRPQSLAQRPSAAGPKGDELVVDPFGAEFDR